MTIIQPNKKNNIINLLLCVLVLGLLVVIGGAIFLYNQLVDFRHEINTQKTDIRRAEVMNAELKNNLYSIINPKKLESLIDNQSLILDRVPQYVKIKQLVVN